MMICNNNLYQLSKQLESNMKFGDYDQIRLSNCYAELASILYYSARVLLGGFAQHKQQEVFDKLALNDRFALLDTVVRTLKFRENCLSELFMLESSDNDPDEFQIPVDACALAQEQFNYARARNKFSGTNLWSDQELYIIPVLDLTEDGIKSHLNSGHIFGYNLNSGAVDDFELFQSDTQSFIFGLENGLWYLAYCKDEAEELYYAKGNERRLDLREPFMFNTCGINQLPDLI